MGMLSLTFARKKGMVHKVRVGVFTVYIYSHNGSTRVVFHMPGVNIKRLGLITKEEFIAENKAIYDGDIRHHHPLPSTNP